MSKDDTFRKVKRQLFLLGLFKIPMVGFVRPKLVQLDEKSAAIKVKLRRRTKNHLNSMYFGALAVGADLAAGLHAFYFAELSEKKMSFAFKGVKGDFLMRAETDIIFKSQDGALIQKTVDEALRTGERINQTIEVVADDLSGNRVARFEMIVSIKFK
jgi:hypothetical protein